MLPQSIDSASYSSAILICFAASEHVAAVTIEEFSVLDVDVMNLGRK